MAKISVSWKQIQGIIGDVTSGIGDKKSITLSRPSLSLAIAGEPWEGPGLGDVFSEVIALVTTEEQKERDGPGTDISVQAIKAIISGGDLNVTPQIGWELTDDKTGAVYSVKGVKKVQPGVDVLVYVIDGTR